MPEGRAERTGGAPAQRIDSVEHSATMILRSVNWSAMRKSISEDVKRLARAKKLDLAILADRYQKELRPFLTGPVSRHDLTLNLWIEAIKEEREQTGT
jgi:hypothetical protein